MIVCGIDPGLKGGIAFISDSKVIATYEMPFNDEGLDASKFKLFLKRHLPQKVFIELAQARPGLYPTSLLTTGINYGIVIGVLKTLGLSYVAVEPSKWTKHLERIEKTKALKGSTIYFLRKERNIKEAIKKWPSYKWPQTPRSKKIYDGQIDAALIADWGLRFSPGNCSELQK